MSADSTNDPPDTRIEVEITVGYHGFAKDGSTHSKVYYSDFNPGDTKKSVVTEMFAMACNVHLDLAEDEGLIP